MSLPLALILTCHAPYLGWLPTTLASIAPQLPPGSEALVVCDGCEPPELPPGWRALAGRWGHPGLARNAGIAATSAPWLLFWDADNLMAPGYLDAALRALASAPAEVAILYPDIQFCDATMQPQHYWQVPTYDYWRLRAENFIDTASLWRRAALHMGGGWRSDTAMLDDYALALAITALGWQAQRLGGPPLLMRNHPTSRLQRGLRHEGLRHELWRVRSLAVVTLLSGRAGGLQRWASYLTEAALPPRTALYLVDNSGQPAFFQRVAATVAELALAHSFSHVDLARVGQPYAAHPDEPYLAEGRHRHVAALYAGVLARVGEDLILTLEDDVSPPLDAVQQLAEAIGTPSLGNVGAAAATYAMPHEPDHAVCAGWGDHGWQANVGWNQVGNAPLEVSCVGGGCTVWANWALRACPTYLDWERTLGWDGVLCTAMRRAGYRVLLHGGVRATHHLHGRAFGVATE